MRSRGNPIIGLLYLFVVLILGGLIEIGLDLIRTYPLTALAIFVGAIVGMTFFFDQLATGRKLQEGASRSYGTVGLICFGCVVFFFIIDYQRELNRFPYDPRVGFEQFNQFFVDDDGSISKERRERIFNRFWKGKTIFWFHGEVRSVKPSATLGYSISVRHLENTFFSDVDIVLAQSEVVFDYLKVGQFINYSGLLEEYGGLISSTQVAKGRILAIDGRPIEDIQRRMKFFAAIRREDVEEVDNLISGDPGLLLLKDDEFGATALHWAAYLGHAKLVGYLLAYEEVTKSINEPNKNGQTPLFQAEYGGHNEIAENLKLHGAK